MASDPSQDVMDLLPPLLRTLDALALIARYLNPPEFAAVMDRVGAPDDALRGVRARIDAWPEALAEHRACLAAASDAALAGFQDLRAASDLGGVFRALRHLPRGLEALYPLAGVLPPVSRFFLAPAARDDADLIARLAEAPDRADVGVFHAGGEPGARGAFSIYIPEYYSPERSWPLVVALHGGSGNGRAFLWSWLRDARSRGAILVAPTAVGQTWALMGEDPDTPNLAGILAQARGRWNIDPDRLLLTGMSDGGTFSYVSGLEPASPFTHLAPVSAAFHPMLAEMADGERLRGLPILITHGALDWMFPVEVARQARDALAAAGAKVSYNEISDLSHTYPREANGDILDWLGV